MSIRLKKVRELMMPLDDYAVVPEDSSMIGALFALDAAQRNRPPGRDALRAVLVVNDKNEVVGKLGHVAFLRALEPKYKKIGDIERLSREGWSSDFLRSMMDTADLWKQRFQDYALRAKRTMVKDVMRQIETGLDIDAPLSEAVHQLVIQETLSLLVMEKGRVVGILRLTDVFNEIGNKMMLWATQENNHQDVEE